MTQKRKETKILKMGICYQFSENGQCSYGDSCKFRHLPSSEVTQSQKPKKKKSRKSRKGGLDVDSDHIDSFFAQYPDFDYRKGRPIVEEFYRMCDYFKWDRDDEEKQEAHQDFKTAMVLTFNELYGTDVDDIDSWHKLCVALNIDPLPKGLKECRKAVQKVHVNLVDLVDTGGEKVEVFDSLRDLQDYTIETGKFFPKESAYAGGVLKALLREILNARYRRPGGPSRG